MSIATDMLAQAQTAYQDALKGRAIQKDGRRREQHDISALRAEIVFWQKQVDTETAQAAGTFSRAPIRFNL